LHLAAGSDARLRQFFFCNRANPPQLPYGQGLHELSNFFCCYFVLSIRFIDFARDLRHQFVWTDAGGGCELCFLKDEIANFPRPRSPGPLAREIRDLIFKETKLTASAGVGPNKLVAKIASEINKPNGQYEVTAETVAEFMEPLPVRKLWGIGAVTEEKLAQAGITTCGQMQQLSRPELHELFGKFGSELYDLCRGIDDRPVEPNRERKSLSTEETFSSDLTTLEQCDDKVAELFEELAAELAQKEPTRRITKIFLKLKFSDFTRTTIERAGLVPNLINYRLLLEEAFSRTGKKIRLIGIGVRFAEIEQEVAQLPLL